MPNIDLSILNQRQTPAFYADVFANRPAAGFVGRIFVSTDTYAFYRDNGTGWDLIGGPGTGTVTGTGANGQVTFWNGASTITGSNDLFWDATNGHLGVNTNAPGTALDVHHDQPTVAILNQTVATNDVRIGFQNNGVGLWRIGAFYNAGANDFGIYDAVAAIQPVTVKKTTGQVLIGTSTVGSGKLVVASSSSDNGIQIVGASAPSLRIDSAESGPTKRVGLGISTATNNFIQGSADRDFCIFNGSTAAASPILFGIYDAAAVNVQEAARISAARNFLIGTTTDAGQKLQVTGTALISGTSTFSTGALFSASATLINSDNSIFRYTNNYMYVQGATAGGLWLAGGSTRNNNIAIRETLNSISLYTSGNENFIIDSSGNVGINTLSPFGKLSVNVTSAAPSTSGNMANGLTTHNTNFGRAIQLGVNDSGAYNYIQSAYVNNANVGTSLAFFMGAAESMRIAVGTANVLIGTTTDNGNKLQVAGIAQATSFRSINGTKSIASGATETIYSIPASTAADGTYLVHVEVTTGSAIYMASGVVTAIGGNGEAFFTSFYDGANVTLSVSGLNIQVTNGGFSTFTWSYSILFQSNN